MFCKRATRQRRIGGAADPVSIHERFDLDLLRRPSGIVSIFNPRAPASARQSYKELQADHPKFQSTLACERATCRR